MQTRFEPTDHIEIWDEDAIARGRSRRSKRPMFLALAILALGAPILAAALSPAGEGSELAASGLDTRPVGTVFAPMDWGHEL